MPHGYRFLLVTEAALEPRPRIEPHPRFRDWLFTTERTGVLEELGLPIGAPRATTCGSG